jgi:hypothetical protein
VAHSKVFPTSISLSGLREWSGAPFALRAADVVGYEITDSSLVFIEGYAGAPALAAARLPHATHGDPKRA